jgi:hypothetical protein
MKQLTVIFGALVALACCSCTEVTAQAKTSRHVIVGVDVSGSARNVAAGYGQGLRRLAMRLDSKNDTITIVRFGTTCEEVYHGPAPSSSEKFTEFYNENFAKGSTSKGTHPAKLFATFNQSLARVPAGARVSLVVFTDGGNDDLSAEAAREYAESVRQLSTDARIERVVFAGVRPGQREAIYRLFGPLQDRLIIQGEDKLQVDLS